MPKNIKLRKNLNIIKKNLNINRLFVYKSNKYIYCQIISGLGIVLASISSLDRNLKKYINLNFGTNININICKFLGKCVAYKVLFLGISNIIFDRSFYKYHGCVKIMFLYFKKFSSKNT